MDQTEERKRDDLLRISVITVVRNGVEFVEETMLSVLGQSYKNIEYIIIDGGSSDGTVNIIKKHAPKLAYWRSEKDDGIADAFNKGVLAATGQYLMLLNADDKLANSDVVSEVAKALEKQSYPALLYGDCEVLDRATGNFLYRASISVPSKMQLCFGKMIPQPSLFSHRSYFDKYGLFDMNFKIAMDFEWLLRGGMQERLVHSPLLVTSVRTGGVSTANRENAVREIIRALRKNGYISSDLHAFCLRSYFALRGRLKGWLSKLRLFGLFTNCAHESHRQGQE